MMHRETWKKQMLAEFPKLQPFMVDYILDVYEKTPDFFKKQRGRPRKTATPRDVLKKIDDAITEIQGVEIQDPSSTPKTEQALNIINPMDDAGKPDTIKLTF
jgi:hypothetical protein